MNSLTEPAAIICRPASKENSFPTRAIFDLSAVERPTERYA